MPCAYRIERVGSSRVRLSPSPRLAAEAAIHPLPRGERGKSRRPRRPPCPVWERAFRRDLARAKLCASRMSGRVRGEYASPPLRRLLDARFGGHDTLLVARQQTNQALACSGKREAVGAEHVALEEVAGECEAREDVKG